MPLPISDKEDEWVSVFSLISGRFSQPVGCDPVSLTGTGMSEPEELGQLRTAACKSGLCDSIWRAGLPSESAGALCQGRGALNS